MNEKEDLPEHWKEIEELRNIQSSDVLFKLIMKNPENIKTFLQAYEPKLAKNLDLESIRILDTEKYNTIEGKKKYLDLAFEVNVKDKDQKIELYFIVEHKSSPDKGIFLQLLSYIYAKYEEAYRENKEFPNIVPMVIYVGKEDWNIPTSTVKGIPIDEEVKDYLFNLAYTLKTPKDMDPEKVEAIRKDVELYGYALLMKIASGEVPIELGLEKIVYVFKDTTYLRYFLLEVYRNVNIDLERFKSILSTLASGGEDMRNLFEDAIRYGEERGIEKGKIEGRIEGRIEGEIKGKIEAITDILSLRFPNTDLSDITNQLKQIEDIDFLDYLRNQAKTVSSIEEFGRLLERF